jgi:hypothetical protein
MSENISVQNLSVQLDNIQNIYNGYLSDTTNHGCIVNLCISVFDYIDFNLLSANGFDIISMDLERQTKIYQDINASELERSRAVFRLTLFLTICYTTFNHFIGLLQTAELIPKEDLTKHFQPDDPKKNIVETIRKLHEIKKYTTIDFPSIHKAIFELLPNLETTLKNMLATFDDESAILYNQEKRRIFKPEVFGQVVLEVPEDDELKEMKRKCNWSEAFETV